MFVRICSVVVSLQLMLQVSGYKTFQDRIPNGNAVPHPCKPNYVFHGVGHKNPRGGGERNPFGLAFYNAGKQWTKALCQADTDGDGKTNGQELGDPDCNWTPGAGAPARTTGLTHPGICDPLDSDLCKNKIAWLDCSPEDFKCDAVNEIGMQNITIRFPTTKVPKTETTYFCMAFDLPQDNDYHLTATVPHIDNAYVMHHILLFGCDESDGGIKMPLNTPKECRMGDEKCNRLISAWSVGMSGDCLHKNIGIRFGTQGYKRAMLQFHYNNPELKSDYTDSSGINLFYTTNRRQYDAGVLLIGQTYLEIKPQQERVEVVGTCHSYCTNKTFTGSVRVTAAFNHMHYLGIQMKIEQFRDGAKIRIITNDQVYRYDDPVQYEFEDPFEVRPGDELKATCVYKSLNKNKTTFYGDGTSDEMCFGFLTYYPESNIKYPECYSWKGIPMCKVYEQNSVIDGCYLSRSANLADSYNHNISNKIYNYCQAFGPCTQECLEERKRLKDHPCLQGDVLDFLRANMNKEKNPDILRFWAKYESCEGQMREKPCVCKECPKGPTSTAIRHTWSSVILAAIFFIALCFGQK